MFNFENFNFYLFLDSTPWIMKLNIFIALFFISLALIFFISIIWIRIFKIYRNEKKRKQQGLLIDFLNSYLFDEDFNKELEIKNFKENHLKTPLEIKVTIKEILHFHENLKGESARDLEVLFRNLGLVEFTLMDLDDGRWFTTARAINALSELSIEVPNDRIEAYLNESRNEVRQQSQLYFLKLAKEQPLKFLDKTVRPLTTWQQIYIENALKNFYKGPAPDFSQWLDHELTSVVEFSIRMIARYNQFENIPKLIPFLKSKNDTLKCEAINSLTNLEDTGLLELLIPDFSENSRIIKLQILEAVKQLGSYEDLKRVGAQLAPIDWELRIKYHNIEQGFLPEKKELIYSQFMLEKRFEI
ncbi:hypothetical protein BC962_2288 [Gillisia mitskevichiae]|uniref:HEAT repeat protein n=1 Tax=Gillisia mitskevichiae TaxID=270921 RepID=A0A495PM34_9FLAO|nr:hypothetical protein [Gillisia mitskevichiae]RKS50518.1 hypothetical protein BC962_2288 [Gillisia mitskevichiae]